MRDAAAERPLVGAVFVLSFLLYLSFRSLYFNFDGVACAIAVELGDFKHLVHGNHLAYGVLGWLFDRSWRMFGYEGRAILPLQVLNAFFGAAGAAVFASMIRRSGRSERESFLGGAALAVSQAWWFWSLEAQVYMLGAFFAALAAREALGENPRPVLVGFWHAGAVLGHVGHAMAFPALAFVLASRRGRREIAPYIAVLVATGLAAYAAAGFWAVAPHTLRELKLWLLGSAALSPNRAFAWHGAPAAIALPSWAEMTLRIFCEFVGRSGAAWAAGVALAVLPAAAAVWGAVLGGWRAQFWSLWLAGYALLFMSWEPATIVYRVSDLLGLWALALIGIEAIPPRARWGTLLAWAVAAGLYNFAGVVRPAADPASNRDLAEARWVAARAPRDAWVLATSRGVVYLPYFMGVKPLNLRDLGRGETLSSSLDALTALGFPVYATDRTLASAGVLQDLEAYGLRALEAGDDLTFYRVGRRAFAGVGDR